MATYERIHHYATRERLLKAKFVVAAAWTLNGTDYWTIALYRRTPGQVYGTQIGSTYSLGARNLTANVPVTFYDDDKGVALDEGDILFAKYTTAGSPLALTDPRFLFQLQKIAR